MKKTFISMGLCVGLALAAAPAEAQEDFEWRGEISAGNTIEIRGISGDVYASLASGSTAEIVATKSGRRSDFDDVEIAMFEEDGDVLVCVFYGSRRNTGTCGDRHNDGNWDDRDNRNIDVSVDIEIRVPPGSISEARPSLVTSRPEDCDPT